MTTLEELNATAVKIIKKQSELRIMIEKLEVKLTDTINTINYYEEILNDEEKEILNDEFNIIGG